MRKLIMPILIALFVLSALIMGSKNGHKQTKVDIPTKPTAQAKADFSCLVPLKAAASKPFKPIARAQQECISCHVPQAARASQVSEAPVVRNEAPEKAPAATVSRHQVVKGECLWTIAENCGLGGENWPVIHQANPQIKNPHWIFPKQILVIPTVVSAGQQSNAKASSGQQAKKASTHQRASKPSVKASTGVFLWTVAGGNPFGKRNHRKALGLVSDDKEFTNLLINHFATAKPVSGTIKPGTDFEAILFGNYQWRVPARWAGKTELNALVWPEVEYKGRLWTITLTAVCNNLELSSRPVPPKEGRPPKQQPPTLTFPPEIPTQPPTIPTQPPTITRPPEIPTQPPTIEPPKREKPCCSWSPDYKGSLFLAQRWGVNNPSTDKETIFGGELDLFPGYCGEKDRTYHAGASIKGVGWDGQFKEKNGGLLKFNGNQVVYGGVLERRTPKDLTILHLRYGEQEGEAKNNTGYYGKEENKLINIEARHLHKTSHDWPSEVQVAASGNIDVGGKKSSSVNGTAMTAAQDPRRYQSQYAILGQASLYASDKVEPLVGLVVDHTPSANVTGIEPYIGAKVLEEQFEPSARYRVNVGQNDPGDTTGFNLVWNFDRTFSKAYQYVRKTWANRGVSEAQAAEPAPSAPVKTIVPNPVPPERP